MMLSVVLMFQVPFTFITNEGEWASDDPNTGLSRV